MALQKKNISIDLTSGVNTKIDERLSNQPTEMENVYIDKDAVLRKMNGFSKITNDVYEKETTGAFIPSGIGLQSPLDLISNKGDSVIMDAKGLYGLSLTNYLVKKSTATSFGMENKTRSLLTKTGEPYNIAMAETIQAYHVTYESLTTGLTGYKVLQKSGNTISLDDFPSPILPITSGDEVYIVARTSISPQIVRLMKQDDFGNDPVDLGPVFDVGLTTGTNIDVAEHGDDLVVVSTGTISGPPVIFIAIITKLGVVLNSVSYTVPNKFTSPVSVITDGNEISVLYSETINVPPNEITANRMVLDSNLLVTSNTVLGSFDETITSLTINLTGIYHNGSFIWAINSTDPDSFTLLLNSAINVKYGLSLASKLFEENGELFLYVIDHTTGLNGPGAFFISGGTYLPKSTEVSYNYKLIKLTLGATGVYEIGDSGTLSEKIGSSLPVNDITFGSLYPANARLVYPLGGFAFMTGTTSLEFKTTVNINEVNFSERKAEPFIEYGDVSIVVGSRVFAYDGVDAVKIAPDFYPSPYHYAKVAGSLTGTYQYKAIIVYTDNRGNIYRSRPSTETEITLAAEIANITYYIEPLMFEDVQFVSVELYQKELADEVYKKVGDSAALAATGTCTIQYQKDFGINLYSTGGILENDAPFPARASVFHNGRVFYINALKDNSLLFSKKYVIGEAVQFSGFQEIVAEDNQGRRAEKIECLASLDSRLIIFKKNSILAIFGEGPDATGANNDFSEPELVTTDTGCSNQRSVVLTGAGVMFQSQKGIYVLTRGMGMEFIGAEVEKFTSPVVQSDLMETENQVRFILKDGTVLIYNYFFKKWTHWTLESAVSSLLSDKGWQYLLSTGELKIQDNASFRDNGAFIGRRFDTGWLKLNGVQGFQRIWRLIFTGEYIDSHQLRITAEYDYKAGGGDVYLITPDALLDYQYEVHLKRQKCQSVRFIIEDVDTGATEEGCRISNITIMAGVKRGFNKITNASKN